MSVGKKGATKIDPEKIFRQGVEFHIAARILSEHCVARMKKLLENHPVEWHSKIGVWSKKGEGSAVTGMVSSFVCSSFSTELYFKTFISLETGAIPKSHDFVTLFGKLSASCQDKIRDSYQTMLDTRYRAKAYARKMLGHDLSFDHNLQASSKSFEKWRYSFESEIGDSPAEELRDGIFEAILKDKPDWNSVVEDMAGDSRDKISDHSSCRRNCLCNLGAAAARLRAAVNLKASVNSR